DRPSGASCTLSLHDALPIFPRHGERGRRGMHKLIEVCVTRSRPVLLVLATLLIAGLAAYFAIPKESEPDVAIPIIYVNLTHEGIDRKSTRLNSSHVKISYAV